MEEIARVAAAAGFSGDDLPTAVAVAWSESRGGDPNAYNPEEDAPGGTPPGKGSYGLWQIYLLKHPEFSNWNLRDPATNAAAAFKVYSDAGQSFYPWSDFKNGKYMRYLDAAKEAVLNDARTGYFTPAGVAVDYAPPPPMPDSMDMSQLNGPQTSNWPLILGATGVAIAAVKWLLD